MRQLNNHERNKMFQQKNIKNVILYFAEQKYMYARRSKQYK